MAPGSHVFTTEVRTLATSPPVLPLTDALFEEAFDACSVAMVLADKHFTILRANQAWCDLTGFGPDDYHGKTCAILKCDTTDCSEFRAAFKACQTSGTRHTVVLDHAKKNGMTFKNHLTMTKVKSCYLYELRDLSAQPEHEPSPPSHALQDAVNRRDVDAK